MNNEIIKVECTDFTFDGQGFCVDKNKKIYFVPSLLIGEEAEIEVLYRKKDYSIGKIKKILKFSPYRIIPKCKCATSCGGCSFQNLDYKKELEYKKKNAISTLKRVGKIDLNEDEISIHGMENPYYYRNKIQIPFGYDKQHRLVYGFYKFKTHDIVPISECVIEDECHVEILKNIARIMKELGLKAYNEDKETGLIRHVLIRVGKVSKEIMVTIVVTNNKFDKNKFSKALIKSCPNIKTLILNINPRKTNVILGNFEETLYGKGYINDYLLGIKFQISSKSFYQVNHDQCEKLYGLAIKKAQLKKDDVVLDAYCGIGTIGLSFARNVKKVIGVEIVKEAIKDARLNAKINKINNVEYHCMDAADYIFDNKFDCVIVDPPRKGLDEKFINSLLYSKPKKIVYISCDVGTLARDLSILKEKYEINSVDFVDMFPRTYHIETVCSLSLKG